ncbi:MAG: glycosyltransferase family 4 protein [Rhodocyclales bacterium]|nr:glycosyltransferase family 4 protein [Rhodocyclales bacterium]
MRVCHIGFNFFPGQGLTIFYEFARHQARQGLDVMVIAPGRPDEPSVEIIDGVRVHRIPLHSIGRFSFDRIRFLIQASRILRGETLDLVHVYAFVGTGILSLLGKRKDTCWLYDCQTSAIKPPLLGLQNWLVKLESRGFDAITVLSEGIRDIVFGAGAPVAAIVPLGADFARFQPRPPDRALMSRLGIAATDCVLSYCGTLDHNRHMDKLIDAFAVVAGQNESAKLMIIGDGSALGELKQKVRKLKLDDRVLFTGLIPYGEIPAYLSITAIGLAFISMDACFEHQPPTKTVEYLAQGLPVIATDTAGNRTFVRHDVNGVLSRDSAEDYGQAMLDLVRDADRRLRLAARTRDSVKEFDWGEIVRMRVIPTYRRILDECEPTAG